MVVTVRDGRNKRKNVVASFSLSLYSETVLFFSSSPISKGRCSINRGEKTAVCVCDGRPGKCEGGSLLSALRLEAEQILSAKQIKCLTQQKNESLKPLFLRERERRVVEKKLCKNKTLLEFL
jgi:hypothetical protein